MREYLVETLLKIGHFKPFVCWSCLHASHLNLLQNCNLQKKKNVLWCFRDLISFLTSPRVQGTTLEYLEVQRDPGWLASSGSPNISVQFLANSFSVSQVWPKSCERSNLIAAGRGERNNNTTWLMQNCVSKSRRISSCSPVAAAEPHQVSGWINGSSAMRAGGWSSARQRGWVGRQEELLVQQLVSVKRVLPLAKLPIGGLQARPTHLDSV